MSFRSPAEEIPCASGVLLGKSAATPTDAILIESAINSLFIEGNPTWRTLPADAESNLNGIPKKQGPRQFGEDPV
jgi:hypothetical protein